MIPTLFNVPAAPARSIPFSVVAWGTIPVVRSVKRKPTILRSGAAPEKRKKKRLPGEILKIPVLAGVRRCHRKKKRFQVLARNRMTSASGFTWVAASRSS